MDPSTTRSPRTRRLNALLRAGMLLGLAGLTAVGLEQVSYGHEHLEGGHAVHHHHVFLGDHDHHHDHDDSDHDAPAPPDRQAPRRTATVSAAPALFQPVVVGIPAAPLAYSAPVAPAPALPQVPQPVVQQASPRGPPAPFAVPGSLS